MLNEKWVKRFIKIAKEVSTWSKDPSTQVGAVIIGDNKQIISQGFNGFPKGVNDSIDRYNDRDTKYKYIIHAEENAIFNALQNGAKIDGATLIVSGLPICSNCTKSIIQTGISHVVCVDVIPGSRWADSWDISRSMLEEAGVAITTYSEHIV